GVEVRTAEVVVGVPSVGGEREHDASAGSRAHDEERHVASHLLPDVDLHRDLVVARAPRGVDVERERGGPTAALRRRVVGCRVLVCRDGVGAENHLTSPPGPAPPRPPPAPPPPPPPPPAPPAPRTTTCAIRSDPRPPLTAASSSQSRPRAPSPEPND